MAKDHSDSGRVSLFMGYSFRLAARDPLLPTGNNICVGSGGWGGAGGNPQPYSCIALQHAYVDYNS